MSEPVDSARYPSLEAWPTAPSAAARLQARSPCVITGTRVRAASRSPRTATEYVAQKDYRATVVSSLTRQSSDVERRADRASGPPVVGLRGPALYGDKGGQRLPCGHHRTAGCRAWTRRARRHRDGGDRYADSAETGQLPQRAAVRGPGRCGGPRWRGVSGSAGLSALFEANELATRERRALRMVCHSRIANRALEATELRSQFTFADTVPEALKHAT